MKKSGQDVLMFGGMKFDRQWDSEDIAIPNSNLVIGAKQRDLAHEAYLQTPVKRLAQARQGAKVGRGSLTTLRCIICGRPMVDVTGAAPGTLNCQQCGDAYRRMLAGMVPRADGDTEGKS